MICAYRKCEKMVSQKFQHPKKFCSKKCNQREKDARNSSRKPPLMSESSNQLLSRSWGTPEGDA